MKKKDHQTFLEICALTIQENALEQRQLKTEIEILEEQIRTKKKILMLAETRAETLEQIRDKTQNK